MVITLKEVRQADNDISVLIQFTEGTQTVHEYIVFSGAATLQELVAKIKASAKRLYQAAATTNLFNTYVDKQYNYNFDADTVTEIT